MTIDVLMTLSLLFLMGFQFFGDVAHEWVGVGIFALFIAHHIVNGSWHRNLFKGKYSPMRVMMLCVDVLVLCSMLLQVYSSVVMSRYVFAFLPLRGGMRLARQLHILGAYWGFAFMSLHIGIHWGMLTGVVQKSLRLEWASKVRSIVLFIAGLAVAAYGMTAFPPVII